MKYGYCRVSTGEQVKGTSLDEQEAKVRAFGATVVFRDEGVSGSVPFAKRDGGRNLNNEPKGGGGGELKSILKKGDVVIAAKLDRMFRSALDALQQLDEFKSDGIDVVLADMGLDPVTGNGMSRMFFTMLAAFAEFERHRLGERIADGKASKAEKGGALGGRTPFGWQKVGSGKEAMLVHDPLQQQAIQRIDELRADGHKLRDIAEHIQAEFSIHISAEVVRRVLFRDREGAHKYKSIRKTKAP